MLERLISLLLIAGVASFIGCADEPIPKPRGYHRIEMPAFEYAPYQHPCGMAFEVPIHSKIERIEHGQDGRDACWFNCSMPRFSAKIHCTHMALKNDIHFQSLVEDAYQMVFTHEMKAAGIRTQEFHFPDQRVSGVLYSLTGPVASPIQFYATDSTSHFLRGSLYFNHPPNPDSLKPSLDHVEKDVIHLIETLSWTQQSTP
jgi:gliding motility-associated lipoprotein GldD